MACIITEPILLDKYEMLMRINISNPNDLTNPMVLIPIEQTKLELNENQLNLLTQLLRLQGKHLIAEQLNTPPMQIFNGSFSQFIPIIPFGSSILMSPINPPSLITSIPIRTMVVPKISCPIGNKCLKINCDYYHKGDELSNSNINPYAIECAWGKKRCKFYKRGECSYIH